MDPGPTPKPLSLSASQVVRALGTNEDNTLSYWPLIAAALDAEGIGDLPVLIAAAATVRVETGLRFEPIHEYPLPGGGYPAHYSGGGNYHGRGFIQLTHDYNYRAYGNLLGVDLEREPDLALSPGVAARVLASYFHQHGIADMARQGDWVAVRKAVQGGTAGWDAFHGSVMALEDATSTQEPPAPSGPSLVQPVVAQGQFDARHYDTAAEFQRMKAAACSAAALAAVLTAYGTDCNISGALRRIRASGDDVTAEHGLMNTNGQGQAVADVLTAARIPSRTHPQTTLSRAVLRKVLESGRPIISQMNAYHGFGHYLVVTAADDAGVTVEDSNAGPGRWTRVDWPTYWAAQGNGVSVWAD